MYQVLNCMRTSKINFSTCLKDNHLCILGLEECKPKFHNVSILNQGKFIKASQASIDLIPIIKHVTFNGLLGHTLINEKLASSYY